MSNNNMNAETYYPKPLARFNSKSISPLTLHSAALDVSLKTLANSKVCMGGFRDVRAKKSLRKYLAETLPMSLQIALMQRAVDKWYGSERLMRLMDIFEPKKLIRDRLDLAGAFRYAYGCYYTNTKLYWSNGTIERLNLNSEQCDQLYQLVLWSDAIKKKLLKTIILSTERGALHKSTLPNIFARSTNLTSVTILNGATNHILRIIGLNCPQLQLLDVSHSQAVTDQGLKSLLLKRINAGQNNLPEEMNKCCQSLCKIILLGTEVSHFGANWACKALDTGYYMSFLPDTMIARPLGGKANKVLSVRIESAESLNRVLYNENTVRGMECIVQRFVERRRGFETTFQCLDQFITKGDTGSQIFLRSEDSFVCEAMIATMQMKNTQHITQLILSWDSFTWSVNSLPDLTEIGLELPSLVVLKARIQGVWEREDLVLFPYLKETYVWTVCDATVLSFLRFCPKIQTFKFNCLDLIRSEVRGPKLTDRNFQNALRQNSTLLKQFTEVSLRPAPGLTKESAKFLIRHCRKMQRLGDMESWNISTEDIRALNEGLDRINSKCILTVLSFPPKGVHQYLL